MRTSRFLGVLALTFALTACGPAGEPVSIRSGELYPGTSVCYLSFVEGELVVDDAGTAIVEDNGHSWVVIWPVGWTGRSSGSQVEVLDDSGSVMARTGTRVHLMGGYHDDGWLTCVDGVKAL